MSRTPTGSLTWSRGTPFVKLTINGQRRSFRLNTLDVREAERRKDALVQIAKKLRVGGKEEHAEGLCRQAAAADERTLSGIFKVVDGLVAGRERPVVEAQQGRTGSTGEITFKAMGEMWTSGDLARRFRRRIKEIDHTENIGRLERYVYPFIFEGVSIAETPMRDFTTEHADAITAQEALPDGSVRHVAQLVSRICKLAAYPLKAIPRSPLPDGWLPPRNAVKEKSYLFPAEEAAFHQNVKVPVVRRLLIGLCAREGLRKENAVSLEWPDLVLDQGVEAMIVLDTTKNGRGGSWVLDTGTAEALRRWRTICPSTKYVFPASASLCTDAPRKTSPSTSITSQPNFVTGSWKQG